jgi:hypothetical protein
MLVELLTALQQLQFQEYLEKSIIVIVDEPHLQAHNQQFL